MTHSDALSCGPAGALAVALPTAMDSGRMRFLAEYYAAVLRKAAPVGGAPPPPVPTHLILVSAAFSGAILLGGSDMLAHRLLGLRW